MLASSGKCVDDVMVVVRDNWEFDESEDRLDPVPRQKGELGGRIVFHVYLFIYLLDLDSMHLTISFT